MIKPIVRAAGWLGAFANSFEAGIICQWDVSGSFLRKIMMSWRLGCVGFNALGALLSLYPKKKKCQASIYGNFDAARNIIS